MQNTNKNRRGKVAAIFLALLVTATAVPAMSISAFAAENNTGISTQDVGGQVIRILQIVERILWRICRLKLQV